MSDNEIKFNLAEYLVGMENRLSANIKGVEDNVNRVETNLQAEIKGFEDNVNRVETNLQAEIKGVEDKVNRVEDKVNRVEDNLQADIRDVKADNNKRHDDHARETTDKIKELKVSIKWWIGIGLAVVTIVLGILEYNSSKNSNETNVNHVIKLR